MPLQSAAKARQNDLFKARLDQIVDMSHAAVKRAGAIDWGFLEKNFGAAYCRSPMMRKRRASAKAENLGRLWCVAKSCRMSWLSIELEDSCWMEASADQIQEPERVAEHTAPSIDPRLRSHQFAEVGE